ncbi:hypothetical protein F4801DRAFT_280055 [Xylaria longipes]|nr:hypothetical protein F4801DRAFT_280055 [Xylaria longipes]
MADIPDFNFDFSDLQQDPQESSFDFFADMNFSEDFDPGFEVRLAEDYPVEEEPVPSSPLQPEAPILFESNPQPSDEICSQQQQFINPQLLCGAQSTYAPPDLIDANGLNIDWPLGQEQLDIMLAQEVDKMLAQDPIFNSQPLDTQVFSNYFSMNNQVNDHPIIHEQPVANQINGQQMLHQQPMEVSWSLQHGPVGQPILQAVPQIIPQPLSQSLPQPMLQPVSQQMPQPMPPSMPQPRPPGMPPPPHQLVPQPMSSRPIPTGPLPQVAHKPVDPGADSFIPLQLRSSRNSRDLPSAGTKTTSPPLKRPAKNHNGEALLNDRIPRKTHQKRGPQVVEPERYYGPSPPRPRDWGPRDHRGKYLFTYTEKGELAAGLFLTAREMRLYLLGPSSQDNQLNFEGPYRLPGVKLRTKKKRQGLTLWVGWPAAMSNARYPRGGESTKCRFKNCPYKQRTIALGDPWVILDERQNSEGEVIDPFHNAGYVHLFCLESNFDIVDLWQCLDIRPDYRSFKRESHPYFCLAYKLPSIDAVIKEWWFAAFRNWELARCHGMKRVRTHESSLAQALVNHKLENEPKTQLKNRLKRGGADISKHRGDPEMKKRLVAFRKHGLLDDNGWPVPNADKLLDEMENSKRKRRGNKSDPIIVINPLPSPLPVLDYGQQPHYPVQQVKIEPMDATQSVYNINPAYPVVNPVHLNQPIPAAPYTLQAPNAPVAGTGHKRTRDEAALEDLMLPQMPDLMACEPPAIIKQEPLVKRQRLDGIATETLPTLTPTDMLVDLSLVTGDAGIETQDAPSGYYAEDDTLATLEPLIGYNMDIDLHDLNQGLNDAELDAFFSDPVTETTPDDGKLSGDIDCHVGIESTQAEPTQVEPAPTPPHEARANQSDSNSDSCDGLFGKPGSKTPSSHSATPKAGGSLSEAKTDSACVANEIQIEE